MKKEIGIFTNGFSNHKSLEVDRRNSGLSPKRKVTAETETTTPIDLTLTPLDEFEEQNRQTPAFYLPHIPHISSTGNSCKISRNSIEGFSYSLPKQDYHSSVEESYDSDIDFVSRTDRTIVDRLSLREHERNSHREVYCFDDIDDFPDNDVHGIIHQSSFPEPELSENFKYV